VSWVKLDDQFFDNRKARSVGAAGRELFLAGLCYCASNLTDGAIEKSAVSLLLAKAEAPRRAEAKLVEVGWWEDRGDFYLVHDYLEYNPSRADVEGTRDAAQLRMNILRGSDEVPEHVPKDVRANKARSSMVPSPYSSRKRSRANYDADFTALWEIYPRKRAKADAARAYTARRNQGIPHEELLLAVKHYAGECERESREEQFVMHGATFFGPRERWRDYLEEPKSGRAGVVDFTAMSRRRHRRKP
jgi:hypothetical protein